MRFRSKIDAWLVLLVIATGVLALTTSIPLILRGVPGAIPIAVAVFASVVGLPAWLLLTTSYWFEDEELCIRSGPLRWRIPINQIKAVTPTRNILSSPALSLDRLQIDYGMCQCVLVSPLDKKGFLSELNALRSNSSSQRGRDG
jgi:hypothetical protein